MSAVHEIDVATIESKLPLEGEHLEALQRMKTLDAYYAWSIDLLRPWIGNRVLDAGCGIGNGTALLAEQAQYVLAADLSPQNVQELRSRFANKPSVEPIQLDLDSDFTTITDRKIDTIVCLDVLEHIEDDVQLLRRFHSIAQPDAHLLIKVPAVKWLYGSVDTASGHFRRYALQELRDKAKQAGWEPLSVRWMNAFGVLPYWFKSRVQKRQANLSRTFSPWQLTMIRKAMPWMQRIDRIVGPPIGQSAVLVAKRID
ncbi:putative S-adenosylmethionine-dependent methyltransferase/MSMEI_2290 [Rosistilla carotiformis]|uniref:Putative S-adenosylmethionine-dependent methyltransferase/MSMEI_2290 n=1 Tax=Rosistilla carotiformis TaxID=2528017 RepID=A0A518JN08_9BACT|nr:class I SAM-dependent methyltransferase [Rosistilla carotiformis]QDV66891.1 putative S-adenosylmethionine-dependent methyltransferase/MSMEI_2290 [Rosistilla carotiformis]